MGVSGWGVYRAHAMLDEADQDELQAGPTGVETGFSALISGA